MAAHNRSLIFCSFQFDYMPTTIINKLFHKKPLRIARGQKATFFLKGTWIISKCAYGNGSSKKNHLILCEDAFNLFLSRRLLLAVLWPYHLLFAFHRSYSSERASLHSRLVKYKQAKLDVISICQSQLAMQNWNLSTFNYVSFAFESRIK